MEILIDEDRCVAAGQCVAVAPAVFDQRDEDGIAVLVNENTPAALAGDVEQAIAMCPAMAITVLE